MIANFLFKKLIRIFDVKLIAQSLVYIYVIAMLSFSQTAIAQEDGDSLSDLLGNLGINTETFGGESAAEPAASGDEAETAPIEIDATVETDEEETAPGPSVSTQTGPEESDLIRELSPEVDLVDAPVIPPVAPQAVRQQGTSTVNGITLPQRAPEFRDFSSAPWRIANLPILIKIEKVNQQLETARANGQASEQVEEQGKRTLDKLKEQLKGVLIETFFDDLTEQVYFEQFTDRPFYRDEYIGSVATTLSSRQNPYFLVHGDAGQGKTLIPYEIANRIIEGNIPSRLRGRRVIRLDLEELSRDNHKLPKHLQKGDVNNRLIALTDELEEYQNDVIIAVDISNPALQRTHLDKVLTQISKNRNIPILLIGQETDNIFVKDGVQLTLESREQPHLSKDEVVDIIFRRVAPLEEEYGISVSREAIRDLVNVMELRIGAENFPGQAIEIVERAIHRRYENRISGKSERVQFLEREIAKLQLELAGLDNEQGPLADRERDKINANISQIREEMAAVEKWLEGYEEAFDFLQQNDDYISNTQNARSQAQRTRTQLEIRLAPYWTQLRLGLHMRISQFNDAKGLEFIEKLFEKSYELGMGDTGSQPIENAETNVTLLMQEYLSNETYPADVLDTIYQQIMGMLNAIFTEAFKGGYNVSYLGLTQTIQEADSRIAEARGHSQDVFGQLQEALGENWPEDMGPTLGRQELIETLARATNKSYESLISVFETPEDRLRRIEEAISERYVGQRHFVSAIMEMERNGRMSDKGPVYSAFFLGGSTKGKSELPKIIGDTLDPDCFFDFPIGQAKSEADINTYLGSPNGYKDGEGELYEAQEKCSEGVINFDEIDKVDPAILQSFFYPLLREGITRNKRGKRLDFRNFRIFMSANSLEQLLQMFPDLAESATAILNSEADPDSLEGRERYRALMFRALHSENSQEQTDSLRQMLEELDSGQYAQAFLRRLNYIGYANNFNDQDYKDLVRAIFVHDLGKALREYLRVDVRLSDSAIEHLAKLSINRTRDAANVASVLRNSVVGPIRNLLSQGSITRNDIIDFDFENDEFRLFKLDKDLNRIESESFGSLEARTPRYESAAYVPMTCEDIIGTLAQ